MNKINSTYNAESVNRLIAVWALSEGFLGGFLHLARVPLTGLILGNVAVILITLIAKFSDKNGTIIKATIIVLIVKGILSPYTPITAYLAVFLQGLFGELLFYRRKTFFVSALSLGILVSFFSSIQKVFFLTVIFGKNLWESIDQFTIIIFKDFFGLIYPNLVITKWLIAIYSSIHIIGGILAGLYASRIAHKTDLLMNDENPAGHYDVNTFIEEENISKMKKGKHRKWWLKPGSIIFMVITVSLFVYSYVYPDYPYIEKNSLLVMVLRGLLLSFIWFKFLSPVLMSWFKKLMSRNRNKYTVDIENVVSVIPLFKSIVRFCWKDSSSLSGIKRINRFFSSSLLNLLTVKINKV